MQRRFTAVCKVQAFVWMYTSRLENNWILFWRKYEGTENNNIIRQYEFKKKISKFFWFFFKIVRVHVESTSIVGVLIPDKCETEIINFMKQHYIQI